MRMTPLQIETVKSLVHRHFGAGIWLFGSRARGDRKGGDYDFFVETSINEPDAIIEHKISLLAELQASPSFEDEKIDLVIRRRNSAFDMPIYAVAKNEGVRL